MNKETKIVKNVVKTFCYYDAGSDYFFEGAIVWNPEKKDWDDKQFRQDDYEIDYQSASKNIQKKWETFQKEQSEQYKVFSKLFKNMKAPDNCPVCGGEKLYWVQNEWVLSKLFTKEAIFCGDCKCNFVYHQNSITGHYSTGIYSNFENKATLNGWLGKDCVERYLEKPKVYIDEIHNFNKDLAKLKTELGVPQ